MTRSVSLDDFPNELLLNIFGYLDQVMLMRSTARVSKRWNTLSKSQPMWTYVDLTGIAFDLRCLKRIFKQKLMGDYTRHLSIKFRSTNRGTDNVWLTIFQNCKYLRQLKVIHGHMQLANSLFSCLPISLKSLELDMVKSYSKLTRNQDLCVPKLTNLKSLTLTHCAYFHDPDLTTILRQACGDTHLYNNLDTLNVSGCTHLFQGYPSTASLQTRVNFLSNQLGLYCPLLRRLDVSEIFTTPLRREELQISPSAVLPALTAKLPQLLELNISHNHSLVDLLTYWGNSGGLGVTMAFQMTLFNLTAFSERSSVRGTVTLHLNGWPHRLIELLRHAADPFLTGRLGSLVIVADEDIVSACNEHSLSSDLITLTTTTASKRASSLEYPLPEKKRRMF